MTTTRKLIPALTLAAALGLMLMGCDRQEPQTAPPAASPDETAPTSQQLRSEPVDDAPPEDSLAAAEAQDWEARELALSERQQLRGQRQQDQGWWADEELSALLGLDTEQSAALLQARQALIEARLQARAELLGQRGNEQSVDEMEQAEQLEELLQDQDTIRVQMSEAQLAWEQAVRDILSEAQLGTLLERQPGALAERP
ncbi:MAG: hypothetical protein ACXIUM_09590 [Wenzhouxiangella sp.]